MIKTPFTIFSKPLELPPFNNNILPTEEQTQKIDDSFKQLKDAATQVAEAAIKASKNLEQRLVDTEYRFFSTIDAIEDFVIIKDGEGKWSTVNRAGQNLFGWIHGEYHDRTNEELAKRYSIFIEALQKCSESDERAWMNGKSTRSQECIPYGIGGYKCFDIMKTPVFDDFGKRKELIVIGRDITEDLEKQRRMKAAFVALNHISEIIVILDFRGHIFFCNDAFLQHMNIKSYDSIVGMHICEVVNIPKYQEMWNIVLQNKEWDGICREGSDLNIHITPMMNGISYPIYYICTIRKTNGND